jgi:hypothetical protein
MTEDLDVILAEIARLRKALGEQTEMHVKFMNRAKNMKKKRDKALGRLAEAQHIADQLARCVLSGNARDAWEQRSWAGEKS